MTAPTPDLSEPLRRLGEGVTSWLAANGSGYTPPAGTPRAEPAAPEEQPSEPVPAEQPAAAAVHPSSCRGCPVCAVLGALRGERPDLTDALADVLTAAAAAVRAFSAPRPAPVADPAPPVAGPAPRPDDETGPDTPGVQRIDVA
jgi:hypothetical protein